MDNNNNNSGNNFFNGFLLGALVGAAVVFLLGTKRGKKLLKAISEEGIENISNILEEENELENFDKVSKKEEPSFGSHNARASRDKQASTDDKAMVDKSEGQGENLAQREFAFKEKSFEKPKVRRFFRGISRRVN